MSAAEKNRDSRLTDALAGTGIYNIKADTNPDAVSAAVDKAVKLCLGSQPGESAIYESKVVSHLRSIQLGPVATRFRKDVSDKTMVAGTQPYTQRSTVRAKSGAIVADPSSWNSIAPIFSAWTTL